MPPVGLFAIVSVHLEFVAAHRRNRPCGVFVGSWCVAGWPVPERESDTQRRDRQERHKPAPKFLRAISFSSCAMHSARNSSSTTADWTAARAAFTASLSGWACSPATGNSIDSIPRERRRASSIRGEGSGRYCIARRDTGLAHRGADAAAPLGLQPHTKPALRHLLHARSRPRRDGGVGLRSADRDLRIVFDPQHRTEA